MKSSLSHGQNELQHATQDTTFSRTGSATKAIAGKQVGPVPLPLHGLHCVHELDWKLWWNLWRGRGRTPVLCNRRLMQVTALGCVAVKLHRCGMLREVLCRCMGVSCLRSA